jgi:catalase
MYLFSDRGTPANFRHQNTYSGHTFKFTKADGSFKYVKLHFLSRQGCKDMTNEEAAQAATNPDHATEDLYNAIERGEYPSWDLKVQVMDPSEAESYRWNIFDVTKVWPHSDYPLRPVGTLTLNRNATNYFAEIEQLAFAPSHLIPGIEPTADPMLQARLFSYADSQRHRLGVNYQQIPVNRPLHPGAYWQRDGFMSIQGNYGATPNYPSTIKPNTYKPVDANVGHELWSGKAVYDLQEVTDEDFVQARWFWEMLGRKEKGEGQKLQQNLVGNIANHLYSAKQEIRERCYTMFSRVDSELGQRLRSATEQRVQGAPVVDSR